MNSGFVRKDVSGANGVVTLPVQICRPPRLLLDISDQHTIGQLQAPPESASNHCSCGLAVSVSSKKNVRAGRGQTMIDRIGSRTKQQSSCMGIVKLLEFLAAKAGALNLRRPSTHA